MSSTKIVHIIGIGGIGMSAIAEILHHSNYKVQGSDAHSNNNTNRLKKLGIEVYIGHNADNISQTQIIVHSSAIKSDNAELIAAKNSDKIVIHRSDILAELVRDKYVIAVSGSSGKTTTTAMIASIFDHSNIDATVIVGGVLNSYQSNAKVGKGDIFLIEADESDGTMLKIPANIAVITSINNDHIDHYGTFDDIKEAFSQFINKADFAVLPDSIDINYDGSNAITFGFEGGNIKAINIRQHADSIEFDVLSNWIPVSSTGMTERSCMTKELRQYEVVSSHSSLSSQCLTLGSESAQTDSPSLSSHSSLSSQCLTLGSRIIKDIILSNAIGLHKVSNALAAISVAIKLGISEESIRKGLAEFKGVARRFSLIADVNGVKLIEDYAHHPNEIQATLTAARSITKGKIVGIIEPLRFARVRNFFDEFIRIFMMFDYVILTPVHPPEDEPIHGFGIGDIKKALIDNGFHDVEIINLLHNHYLSEKPTPTSSQCATLGSRKKGTWIPVSATRMTGGPMNDSLLISRFINGSTNSGDIVLFIGAGSNIARLIRETVQILT